jgi:hypothetical protein
MLVVAKRHALSIHGKKGGVPIADLVLSAIWRGVTA